MADNAAQFIGRDALTLVAEQVGKQVVMGPAYNDPELLDRLGIQVISGVQYKRTDHLLVRKGGTTRRKVVGTPVENKIGYLKERTLVAKLSWNRYRDNIDNYVETVFGTDGKPGGDYPFSTLACEAILKSYAEDLQSNLFFGKIANEESANADLHKLSLYDGFHTNIAQDIEDGIISKANGNLVECDAIAAPTDNSDTTPFDTVLEWYGKWSSALRQAKNVKLYCDVKRGIYIAQGYANRFHGNYKVNYLPNGNFTVPEMPRVEFCPSDAWGDGTRLMATIPNNLQYGVDSENNQTFVKTQFGSDEDAQDVIFQIQSIQGTRIMNPLASAFVISDGELTENVINGDYEKDTLVVNVSGNGSVTVNDVAYDTPQEFAANSIIKLKATASSGAKFSQWSNGKTDEEISIVATGYPMAITAIFVTE